MNLAMFHAYSFSRFSCQTWQEHSEKPKTFPEMVLLLKSKKFNWKSIFKKWSTYRKGVAYHMNWILVFLLICRYIFQTGRIDIISPKNQTRKWLHKKKKKKMVYKKSVLNIKYKNLISAEKDVSQHIQLFFLFFWTLM